MTKIIRCANCHKVQEFYDLEPNNITEEECPFCGYYNKVDTNEKSEPKQTSIVNDIHSYTVFANIDDRQGHIRGYQMLLDEKQMEAIEIIVTAKEKPISVKETPLYEFGE